MTLHLLSRYVGDLEIRRVHDETLRPLIEALGHQEQRCGRPAPGDARPTRDAADSRKWRAPLVSSGVRLDEAVLRVLLARLVEGDEGLATSGELSRRLEWRDDLVE